MASAKEMQLFWERKNDEEIQISFHLWLWQTAKWSRDFSVSLKAG